MQPPGRLLIVPGTVDLLAAAPTSRVATCSTRLPLPALSGPALAAAWANALGKPNLDTEPALDRALLRAERASGPAASPRPGRPNSFLDWARGALPVPAWPTTLVTVGK